MEFNTVIECQANDGTQNQFRYAVEQSDEHGKVKWVYRIMPIDLNAMDWYEFSVAIVQDGVGKIVAMDNHNMIEYRGKGITEKMIAETSRQLNVVITSSSNKSEHKSLPVEWRSEPATKVWRRIVEKGEAVYDSERDIFTYTG